MVKQLPYIEPNKWHHRFINRLTCWYIYTFQQPVIPAAQPQKVTSPVWITGFFRSGTSLVARMMCELGFDAGPTSHLLQPAGARKILNPDGFFENYLFMEWSLYAFHQMNGWGHLPPSPQQVENFSFTLNQRKEFIEFTICGVHDDRISNRNKAEVLKKYDYQRITNYLEDCFNEKCIIKNPHFSVLFPILLKQWPNSTMLVCFRHPAAAIQSAKQITPDLGEDVYIRYYEQLLKLPGEKIIFFSYDELVTNPDRSVELLAKKYNASPTQQTKARACFNTGLVRNQITSAVGEKAMLVYNQLQLRAVNK